ncbi:hypothetical protein BDN70DRAFT_918432 [Pholiota conissans]|uniref:Uncharacterized protein n=1 Tax=Pholiota conissans TaxID=109636 RepID=A0A9P5Z9L8_9AGAR|nr:hypothetical protein BDN70DRAFT_918432 [Pholiota conissans]
MASANPSAMLAESLSEFSKSAYKAFTEIEIQARQEVARAMNETREARLERDKALKDLHNSHLDLHSWKQELASSKAALAQAEQTISHQTDTLAAQAETIAQLRRELTQWKDQSRNWQEHFLRVEQERCAQASRIDELIVEKLQHARQMMNTNALFTPKGSNYPHSIDSAPSSTTTKRPSVPSPTQPPGYRTANASTSEEFEPPQATSNTRTPKHPPKGPPKSRNRDAPPAEDVGQELTSSGGKRRKIAPVVEIVHTPKNDALPPLPYPSRPPTVIRRVHAVINVKCEESEDEVADLAHGHEQPKEESYGVPLESSARPSSSSTTMAVAKRRTRSRVIQGDSDYESDTGQSGSERPRRLRNRRQINYEEENYEEGADEEDDELMLGADDNDDEEVFGPLAARDDRRPKKQAPAAPPKKKRRVNGR